jgi:excisionase family DNA binding protein
MALRRLNDSPALPARFEREETDDDCMTLTVRIPRELLRRAVSMPPAEPDPLWSAAQAGEYLGVSEDTVHRWRRDQGLPAYSIAGMVRFRRTDIDRWLAANRVEG